MYPVLDQGKRTSEPFAHFLLQDGFTALAHASFFGRKDIARLLLRNDAKINVQDKVR